MLISRAATKTAKQHITGFTDLLAHYERQGLRGPLEAGAGPHQAPGAEGDRPCCCAM